MLFALTILVFGRGGGTLDILTCNGKVVHGKRQENGNWGGGREQVREKEAFSSILSPLAVDQEERQHICREAFRTYSLKQPCLKLPQFSFHLWN